MYKEFFTKLIKDSKVLKVIIASILTIIAIAFGVLINTKKMKQIEPEIARSMAYEQVKEGEDAVEGTDYVKFDAFFLRDLNGDGYAESIRGTCKQIGESSSLYMDLKVLTNGYLEDGVITINEENMYFQTSIVKDEQIKNSYISNNTKKIELNTIAEGTQKLISGLVRSGDYTYQTNKAIAIGSNTKNYTKVNSVTLTGTHVSNDGTRTTINKTVEFTVDWYGTTKAQIPESWGDIKNINQEKNISEIIDNKDKQVKFKFTVLTDEVNNELNIKEATLKANIPQFNGYSPIDVKLDNSNVEANYNEDTRILTASKKAIVDADGKIKNMAYDKTAKSSRVNEWNFIVKYPIEAYNTLSVNTFNYKLPVEIYYLGYNNDNTQFSNPYKSNVASQTIVINYRKMQGNVARFDVVVGKYSKEPRERYFVSKEKPLKIYNGISQEENNDKYNVVWQASTGKSGTGTMKMSERKNGANIVSDTFIKANSTEESMNSILSNVGIYFVNATGLLGKQGYIKIYNDETNELIETFTSGNWNNYTSEEPYMYVKPVKHIRVETSEVNENSAIDIINIKKIDTHLLTQKYTRSAFDNLSYIKSTLTGYIGNNEVNTDTATADYEHAVSKVELGISTSAISTQKVENNIITMSALVEPHNNYAKWSNGVFLVKFPKEIVTLNINTIESNNSNIDIVSYEQYVEKGISYIKIVTNSKETDSFVITVDVDMIADSRVLTKDTELEVDFYNEYCHDYEIATKDTNDINGNLNTNENIGKVVTKLGLVSPNSLITGQTATNFDNQGTTVVAPQIAMLERDRKTADISIDIINNYSSIISDVQILGKIPTRGSTYVINGGDLGTEFDTVLNGAIVVPEELKSYAKVYYSTNANPTNSLKDGNNNWSLKENVTDWSTIKSYLIDLGSYNMSKGQSYKFNYSITMPESVEYNKKAYSHHAVYFSLHTDEGKYRTSTEPNKLGFMIAKIYDLQITKTQKEKNKLLPGATYVATEQGSTEGMTATTNNEGIATIKKLQAGKTYIIKEIRAPKDYELSTDEIAITTRINGADELVVEKLQGTIKGEISVTKPENQPYKVQIEVEDEVKANLTLKKVENSTNKGIANVLFRLTGNGIDSEGRNIKTNQNGEASLTDLSLNSEYTLQELEANGYYLKTVKFKIVRVNGQYSIEILEGNINETNIVVEEEKPVGSIKITNEKIPTYDLEITKVKGSGNEDIGLKGARYSITSEDTGEVKNFTTNENGKINIADLYNFVSGKYITGNYTLKELRAPEGYSMSGEEIKFRVELSDGKLNVVVQNETNLTSLKEYSVDGNTVKLTLKNSPIFKITKIEKGTSQKLANAKFIIQKVDINKKVIDYAKGTDGNYVGERNSKGQYILTTNENGEITEALAGGMYKITEVEAPEGYILPESEEERIQYFTIEGYEDFVINYIEDLVNMSNSNKDYANKVVLLARDLDFNDVNSYRNPEDTSYRDYNGDGKVEGIKQELTNRDGKGFKTIMLFSGTFLGDGHEISNLYIKSDNLSVGLFGTIKGGAKISDLGVIGEIIIEDRNSDRLCGGIAAQLINNSTIINCYTNINISMNNSYGTIGGIVGYIGSQSKILNCRNMGAITVNGPSNNDVLIGGIVGNSYKSSIMNSYSSGNIISRIEGEDAFSIIGGIIGELSDKSTLINCYNTGKLESTSYYYSQTGGIAGRTSEESSIMNCYNSGEILSKVSVNTEEPSPASVAGGIVSMTSNDEWYIEQGYTKNKIINCYNTGKITSTTTSLNGKVGSVFLGGLIGYATYFDINNCYNTGVTSGSSCQYMYNGAVLGAINGTENTITNTYYMSGAASAAIGATYSGASASGSPVVKTSSQMQAQSFVDLLNNNKNTITSDIEILDWVKTTTYPSMNITLDSVPSEEDVKIVPVTEIEVENTAKTYNITTEIGENSQGNRTGGTITGTAQSGTEIKSVENVKHGNNATKNIVVTPNSGYVIKEITLNGEPIDYTVASNGSVTLPKLENITQNEHYKVVFDNTIGQILVHHYIKGTTNKVAEDELVSGTIGKEYTTSPKTDLVKYELVKGADGSYQIPANSVGTYKANIQEITYYYEKKQIPLRVLYYIEGTQTPVELKDGTLAEEVIQTGIDGQAYTTEALKNVSDKYELIGVPENSTGEYEDEEIVVTYYYRIKKYDITTKVKTYEEINELGQTIKVKGGVISGEDETTYEVVEHGENNIRRIVITPDEGYVVNKITINGEEITFSSNEDRSVVLNTIENITEDKEIVVEFSRIATQVIVHHYIEGTTTKVPSINGGEVEDEIKDGRVGDRYATSSGANVKQNYEVVSTTENTSGLMTEDLIEVIYYYQIKTAGIEQKVEKTGTNKITKEDEKVTYDIKYRGEITDYIGNAKVTIVDTLPFEIDSDKSNLMNGLYNPSNKTVTWEETIEDINTYSDVTEEADGVIIEFTKHIEVVYINMDYSKTSFINKANVKIELDVTSQEEEKEAQKETTTDFKKDITVQKRWEHTNNIYEIPSRVIVQVKNGEDVVEEKEINDTYKTSDNVWEYTFSNLPKYNAEGQEINYTVDEKEVVEGELKYYEKQVNEYTITNKYIGPVIAINKRAETGNALEYVVQGEKITYYIDIINSGKVEKNVTVVDSIPTGTSFVAGSVKINNESTTSTQGDLNNGITVKANKETTTTVSFEVIVNDLDNGAQVKNSATVDGKKTNEIVHTYVESIIRTNKSMQTQYSKNYVVEGEKIIYTINIENRGDLSKNVLVQDNIPEGTEFVTGSMRVNEETTLNTADDLKNGINVNVGKQSHTSVSFEVEVKNTAKQIKNIAIVDGEQTNETKIPVLKYSKSVEILGKEEQSSVTANEDLKYTIKLENLGEETINSIQIRDIVPEGTVVKKINNGGDINQDKEITWTIAELLTGQSSTVSFEVTVKYSQIAYTIRNVAKVNERTTNEVETLYKVPEAELESSIEKTGDAGIVSTSDKIRYTVNYHATVGNFIGKGKLVIVDKLPYEIDLENSDVAGGTYDAETKTITWEEEISNIDTYSNINKTITRVKQIELKYQYTDEENLQGTINNEVVGKIQLLQEKEETKEEVLIKEEEKKAQHRVTVKIPTNIIVHHYIYEEENGGYTTTKIVPDEEQKGNVGDEYTTTPSNIVRADYECVNKTPDKYTGTMTKTTIEVNYYYKLKEAKLKTTIDKTAAASKTEEREYDTGEIGQDGETIKPVKTVPVLTKENGKVSYTISYKVNIDSYKGKAKIQIVDTLPANIEHTKSELAGGKYDAETRTITWEEEIDIDTYANDVYEETITKEIKIVFDGQDVMSTLINTATGKTTLYYPETHTTNPGQERQVEEKNDTAEVEQQYIVEKTVEKIWNDNDNIKNRRPDSVNVQLTANGVVLPDKIKVLNEENNWREKFEGLPKYTGDGAVIDYSVIEKETQEGDLEYYETPVIEGENNIIVTNRYKLMNTELESEIEKQGTDKITSSKQKVNYTINYRALVTEYVGEAQVTIVDYLPYKIDESKSELNGGKYNEETQTITWQEKLEHINTYTNGDKEIQISKDIMVVFSNLDASTTSMTNRVKGTIDLYETEKTNEVNASKDTSIEIQGKVVVKYVDKDTGKEITYKEGNEEKSYGYEITGKVGEEYKTEKKSIDRYSYDSSTNNEEGKIVEENTEVIYYYERTPAGGVVVKYVDEQGNEIVPSDKIEGKIGDAYKTTQKDIENYEYVRVEGQTNGEMGTDVIEVVYVYKKIPAKVIVRYLEKDTNTILHEEIVLNGFSGDKYETERKEIPNYIKALPEPTNKEGKMTKKDTYVIYYYEKIPSGILTVKYIDIDTLEEILYKAQNGEYKTYAYQSQGKYGEDYDTEQKEIPYYNIVSEKLPINKQGKYSQEDMEVIYYYKKQVFNFRVDKNITQSIINGEEQKVKNGKLIKLEVRGSKVRNTDIQVIYKIKVSNVGEIAGRATVIEKLPSHFTVNKNSLKTWKKNSDGHLETVVTLKPGEVKELAVILDWKNGSGNFGTMKNVVEIKELRNNANFKETNLKDNISQAEVVMSIKTGGQTYSIIIISIIGIAIAGTMALIACKYSDKNFSDYWRL